MPPPRENSAIRGVIAGDQYPHAPRLDPLRAALARFDAASKPTPQPKASPPAKADKRRAPFTNMQARVAEMMAEAATAHIVQPVQASAPS